MCKTGTPVSGDTGRGAEAERLASLVDTAVLPCVVLADAEMNGTHDCIASGPDLLTLPESL